MNVVSVTRWNQESLRILHNDTMTNKQAILQLDPIQHSGASFLPFRTTDPLVGTVRNVLGEDGRSREHRVLPIRLRLLSTLLSIPTMTLIDLAIWLIPPRSTRSQYSSRMSFSRRDDRPGNMDVPPDSRMFL